VTASEALRPDGKHDAVRSDRLPNVRLDPDGDDPHIRSQVFRSPTSLPVLFEMPAA